MSPFSCEVTDANEANRQIGLAGIATPCIGVCVMDESGFCRGCARTLDEIGAWTALSPADRLAFMEELPARKAALASDSPV
jgi:predicted Fe-S protein YdhL (DUF1289 family)